MHKSNYRPTKSQQLLLVSLVKKTFVDERIVVHHVLEDTPLRLVFQIERVSKTNVSFERIVVD